MNLLLLHLIILSNLICNSRQNINELSEIYLKTKNKYIGQLLKGTNIIDGKGIEYYENGNKEYEGDWKEGKADGKGIEYYENGNKRYEGDCKEGKADGKE